MFKKISVLLLVAALLCTVALSFASCNTDADVKGMSESPLPIPELSADFTVPEGFKIGFICLHDENSTYDKNFIDAAVEACKNMGVTMVQKTQIPESNACYDAAKELIKNRCFTTEVPDYSESDKTIKMDEEFKNSGIDLSYAIGENEWKGSYPLQFGKIEYADEFKSLQKTRPENDIIPGTELSEIVWGNETKYLKEKDIPDKFTSYSLGGLEAISQAPESGIAINNDMSRLAVANSVGNVTIYAITWNSDTPSLSYQYSVEVPSTSDVE